jgi:hypothetical protein
MQGENVRIELKSRFEMTILFVLLEQALIMKRVTTST